MTVRDVMLDGSMSAEARIVYWLLLKCTEGNLSDEVLVDVGAIAAELKITFHRAYGLVAELKRKNLLVTTHGRYCSVRGTGE